MFRKGLPFYKFMILTIVAGLLLLLLAASTVWKFWRDHKYDPFSEGMTYARSSTGFVPRYTSEMGGDIYYVKYPDYLSTIGNLAIKPEDDLVLDSLIIWPQFGGGFKFGVILNDGGTLYQIYISPDGKTALFEDDQWLVDTHQTIIQRYLAKANAMWDLSD